MLYLIRSAKCFKMEVYRRITRKFPANIVFSFAYGSGVKKQLGYDNVKKKATMVDMVFCVKDARKWHKENLVMNPTHYSIMKYLGSSCLAKYQENLGANVYCNTLIPLPDEGIMIKYGVITENDLLYDLNNWNHLYSAGRLHKPVSIVTPPEVGMKKALEYNIMSALRCALVLLPEKFNKFELFYIIANISYRGDFRMIFGENKNKVTNIVKPQVEKFHELYQSSISNISNQVQITNDDAFHQDKSSSAIRDHLQNLPNHLVDKMILNSKLKGSKDELFIKIASQKNCANIVRQSLSQIVFKSSALQSIKNIPTAGLWKSITYSFDKATKTFASS